MIEIYRRVEGRDRLIRTYDSFENLFKERVNDRILAMAFGYDPEDRTDCNYLFGEAEDREPPFISHHCYICYENDKLVAPDRLVGLYRAWWKDRPRGRWWRYRWTRVAHGYYRAPKTTNEMRWAHAWDDDEFAPVTGFARGRRKAKHLPNLWDDRMSHNDKCWKTQSKRRHQWKNGVK